jgi:uncharacterized protein
MPITRHRVIIDTNLWVSFLLSNEYTKVDRLFERDQLTLLFSQELLDEFIEVAQRPKFKKYFSAMDLQNLIINIRTKAEFVRVSSKIDLCRDFKDNFLLALANDGKASHLITGDKDLLVLKQVNETEILTITEYLANN